MSAFLNDHGYGLVSLGVNFVVGYIVTKARADVAELKVWIYETFEPKKK